MNEAKPVFEGVGVALITLFDDRGDLDVAATADHASRLVSLGVRAVVVAGSTGEGAALTSDERTALLSAVRAAVPAGGPVPVIAGTGAPSARLAVALTAEAVDHGADAVLVLSPPATPDPRPYFDLVAKAAAGLPVIGYHWPAYCPPGISLDMLDELPIAALKDSSGDPERLLATLTRWRAPLYVGKSSYLSLAGPLGCAGAILALANAEPERCAAAFAGDAQAMRELAPVHLESVRMFPRSIKDITARRFGTSVVVRMGG